MRMKVVLKSYNVEVLDGFRDRCRLSVRKMRSVVTHCWCQEIVLFFKTIVLSHFFFWAFQVSFEDIQPCAGYHVDEPHLAGRITAGSTLFECLDLV